MNMIQVETDLEQLWDLELFCEVDHEEVTESARVTLPPCGIVAGAEIVDCQGAYFVCTPLAEFLEENMRTPGITCEVHGVECLQIVRL